MTRNKRASRTDWARIDSQSDKEIKKTVDTDPDAAPIMSPEWMRQARILEPRAKTAVSIRLDDDVIEWFKRRGTGYQTRINAVLRAYVETQR
jgi:uncharacterized protein (DUF4415 family)